MPFPLNDRLAIEIWQDKQTPIAKQPTRPWRVNIEPTPHQPAIETTEIAWALREGTLYRS